MALRLVSDLFAFPRHLLWAKTEPTYTYEPLGDGEIRILHLLPGVGYMRLEVEIQTVKVQDADSQFEALSYCWGSDKKEKMLYINGVPLPITRTLSSFLHRLRSPTKPRTVWTDAVCINQADQEEKGRQIALMASIYTLAVRVLVDLGDATHDSALAIELLQRFWRKHIWSSIFSDSQGTILPPEDLATYIGIELPEKPEEESPPAKLEKETSASATLTTGHVWLQACISRLRSCYRWASLFAEWYMGIQVPGLKHSLRPAEYPADDDTRWQSVSNFFTRPWFGRIWVVQEFALGREVVLLCGTRECKWQHVLAATYPFVSGSLPPPANSDPSKRGRFIFLIMGILRQVRVLRRTEEGRDFLARTQSSTFLWQKFQKIHLLDALHYTHICLATVDKDRYFALLSVVDDFVRDGQPRLELNYTDPAHEIVSRVGRFLIQNEYGEEMLARAGLWQRLDPQIPSWIQDFRGSVDVIEMMDQTTSYMGEVAGGSGPFRVTLPFEDDRFIILRGARLDVVDATPMTAPLLSMKTVDKDVFEAMKVYIPQAIKTLVGDDARVHYFNGQRISEAVCATLISGTRISVREYSALEKGFHVLSWVSVARNNKQAVNWALRRVVKHLGMEWDDAVKTYLQYVDNVAYSAISQRMQPARTRRGYFASVPSCFEPGDEIWVVQGCRSPLLLRKSTQFPGCYQLVRSCYLHGFMEGQALEKPGFRFEQVSLH